MRSIKKIKLSEFKNSFEIFRIYFWCLCSFSSVFLQMTWLKMYMNIWGDIFEVIGGGFVKKKAVFSVKKLLNLYHICVKKKDKKTVHFWYILASWNKSQHVFVIQILVKNQKMTKFISMSCICLWSICRKNSNSNKIQGRI